MGGRGNIGVVPAQFVRCKGGTNGRPGNRCLIKHCRPGVIVQGSDQNQINTKPVKDRGNSNSFPLPKKIDWMIFNKDGCPKNRLNLSLFTTELWRPLLRFSASLPSLQTVIMGPMDHHLDHLVDHLWLLTRTAFFKFCKHELSVSYNHAI